MDKRYQIFVSSTYVDLKDEREEVIRAILEMGHIPVGMEMFSAADEEQWETIKREIDRSDYYLVIVAHRYGSTIKAEGGIGYTEKEFDYAAAQKVPRIGFVIQKGVPRDPEHVDEGAAKKRLDAFKQKIQAKPVNFWTDATDLGKKVAISLQKLTANSPRPGWERSSEGSTRVAEALAQLTRENSDLRGEVERLRSQVSERAPVLDCQFVSKEGQSLGRELVVDAPDEGAIEELRQQKIKEMEALIDEIDSISSGQYKSGVPDIFDLSDFNQKILSAIYEPYDFDPKRIQEVLQKLQALTSKRPRQIWKFQDLQQHKAPYILGPGLPRGPTGGTDLHKYKKFVSLEECIKDMHEELRRASYMNTHKEARLQLSNVSRIAAEDLTIIIDFPDDVSIGMHELDELNRPPLSFEGRFALALPLLVPQESVNFTEFVFGTNKVERIDLTVRILGRNLPEAQSIPITIRVGTSHHQSAEAGGAPA